MILNEDLMRQLQAAFAAEADDHLRILNRDLLILEKQPAAASAELLAEIFREAHSLKGAARAATQVEVKGLAHHLETLFGRLQNGQQAPAPELFDLVYQTLDAIGGLVRGAPAGGADILNLMTQLEAMASGAPAQAAPSASNPAAGEPGLVPPERPGSGEVARVKAIGAGLPGMASSRALVPVDPVGLIPALAATVTAEVGAQSLLAPVEPPISLEANAPRLADETVRIAIAKLDSLMVGVGELQVTRIETEQRVLEVRGLLESVEAWEGDWRKARPHYNRLLHALSINPAGGAAAMREVGALVEFLQGNEVRLRSARTRVSNMRAKFAADTRRMAQVTGELQDDVRRTRMLPIAAVFDAFPRMVRDLAREQGKQAVLVIQGGEAEVDRSVLEQIKDPLMHLLRNSVDHGLELPEVRARHGKSPEGTITLTAAHRGDSLLIEVSDDGHGVDLARVRASAVKSGLLTAEAARLLSDHDSLSLIFRSGLSTSVIITDLSGRGVGLDVVREHVERLHGLIDVTSRPGQGTRFSLSLPLTVATTLCLLAQAGVRVTGSDARPCTFALPIANVIRIVRVAAEDLGRTAGREALRVDGQPVALVRLADVLELATPAPAARPGGEQKQAAIILGSAEKRVAFLVDELLGTQEVVIKNLPRPLVRVRYASGATILGAGEVVLILNVADLLRTAVRLGARAAQAVIEPAAQARQPVIVLAEDSITTRTLEKNILETAGFDVRAAADGLEAWNLMQRDGCDLLVSDVIMPRLSGFELTAKVRADERLKSLPVILVTSLDSREDRERGVLVGADAYLVKGAFDQDRLLDTIRRLI